MTAWLEALRDFCAHHSQAEASRRIGYSSGAISALLSGTYGANTSRIQKAVEGALMQSEVQCPVIGTLPRQRCVEYQRMRFTAISPSFVALYRTCPTCEHATKGVRAQGEKK